MPLAKKLADDMKAAMKSGDKERLETVRYLLSLVQGAGKEKQAKQPGAELSDDEAIAVLQKEAKRRKDAIELFKKGGRADLVAKEEADLAVVYDYIPQGLSEVELRKIVDEAYASGAKDFSSLMRDAMKAAKGRADGKIVGDIVKKKLEE